MKSKQALRSLLAMVVALVGAAGPQRTPQIASNVHVEIYKSLFADYLFYLINGNTGDFPELKKVVPLAGVVPLDHLTFAPEDAATTAGLTSYDQLYQMVRSYPDHVRLTEMLQEGAPAFGKFESYWKSAIAPREDQSIKTWQRQYKSWKPIERLQQLERIRFPFANVRIAVIALDPSGSSMQGKHPTIFTATQVPDVAWVLGHEGTHMLIGPSGANWSARPNAPKAIRLVKASGGNEYDIEEALCLLMQVKLSQQFGGTSADYRASSRLAPSPRRTLLIALENDWAKYLSSANGDAADFLVQEAIKAFQPGPTS